MNIQISHHLTHGETLMMSLNIAKFREKEMDPSNCRGCWWSWSIVDVPQFPCLNKLHMMFIAGRQCIAARHKHENHLSIVFYRFWATSIIHRSSQCLFQEDKPLFGATGSHDFSGAHWFAVWFEVSLSNLATTVRRTWEQTAESICQYKVHPKQAFWKQLTQASLRQLYPRTRQVTTTSKKIMTYQNKSKERKLTSARYHTAQFYAPGGVDWESSSIRPASNRDFDVFCKRALKHTLSLSQLASICVLEFPTTCLNEVWRYVQWCPMD